MEERGIIGATPPSVGGASPRRRRPQKRALATRLAILEAALVDFAERGFDGASTRSIAHRAGLQQPLIAYHFGSKEALWKAVAEHFFAEIMRIWNEEIPDNSDMPPVERVRIEFRAFLRFTFQHPHFHHFMLRENAPDNPRLSWLAQTVLAPIMERILPQIRAAQEGGDLVNTDPLLVYYALVGMVTALSSLRAEIRELTGVDATDPKVEQAYWAFIESAVFPRKLFGR